MLKEIYCEKFKQKRVVFKKGLNVILGTNTGDNSIGKSTFLLIVDFVFGGNTYCNSSDIWNNIGEHDIFFCFLKNGECFYYARNIDSPNEVWVCDKDYNKDYKINIEEYRERLDNYYELTLPDLKFRDAVGRYMRVYGKDNYNEKRLLNYTAKEQDKKACYALLKLFNYYYPISQIEKIAEKSKVELQTYNKAQNLKYIEKIGKREFDKNNKDIEILKQKLEDLTEKLDKGLLDLDSVISEEALKLKENLSRARRMRGVIVSRLKSVDDNYKYVFSFSKESMMELQKFFPEANMEEIDKIEEFHMQISSIFKSEMKEEKMKLVRELKEYDELILSYEKRLKELIENPNLSKNILKSHMELLRDIERINRENESYVKLEKLKKQKNEDEERLREIESKQFIIIENMINKEMDCLNDYIYGGEYNSPIIDFKNNNYTFITPNDTGTGIAYKGLAIFDMAVLKLTKLPILVHDSIVLKQISDKAIEKLLEIYNSTPKQVIIALDKADSYTEESIKLLNDNKVLELAPNGGELFGFSWGKKNSN